MIKGVNRSMDNHHTVGKIVLQIKHSLTIYKKEKWVFKLPVDQRLILNNCFCLEENTVIGYIFFFSKNDFILFTLSISLSLTLKWLGSSVFHDVYNNMLMGTRIFSQVN